MTAFVILFVVLISAQLGPAAALEVPAQVADEPGNWTLRSYNLSASGAQISNNDQGWGSGSPPDLPDEVAAHSSSNHAVHAMVAGLQRRQIASILVRRASLSYANASYYCAVPWVSPALPLERRCKPRSLEWVGTSRLGGAGLPGSAYLLSLHT